MKHYTITGGGGFIGSHLADSLLSSGASVCVLDDFSTGRRGNIDPQCRVIEGDVADPVAVGRALEGAAGCFHLAANASVVAANEDWIGTHRTNQTGSITVLNAARLAGGIPIVYASSAAVYGDLGVRPRREDTCPAPQTPYGADKLGSELHARVAYRVHGVPTLGLRFFNVYGPRQNPNSPYSGVISIFANRLAQGSPITIHGDGRQIRDFVFVADVVDHLTAAMHHLSAHPSALVINVCTGHGIAILQLAELLGALHGLTPRLVHDSSRPGDIRHSVGDPTAARNILQRQACVSLRDGLLRTLLSLRTSR